MTFDEFWAEFDPYKTKGQELFKGHNYQTGKMIWGAAKKAEWQPIAMAPKDVPVLIWDGEMQCVAIFEHLWRGHEGRWGVVGASGYEYENDFSDPTHWMPLSESPSAASP